MGMLLLCVCVCGMSASFLVFICQIISHKPNFLSLLFSQLSTCCLLQRLRRRAVKLSFVVRSLSEISELICVEKLLAIARSLACLCLLLMLLRMKATKNSISAINLNVLPHNNGGGGTASNILRQPERQKRRMNE